MAEILSFFTSTCLMLTQIKLQLGRLTGAEARAARAKACAAKALPMPGTPAVEDQEVQDAVNAMKVTLQIQMFLCLFLCFGFSFLGRARAGDLTTLTTTCHSQGCLPSARLYIWA